MKFYLRILNPVVALVVFILCFWAATTGDNQFNALGIVKGGINTYFFAKGIYTSLSLLILGRILLEILYHSEKSSPKSIKSWDALYSIAFGIFTLGSLGGLLLVSDPDTSLKVDNSIENPPELQVSDMYRIKETAKLKFSGKVSNLKGNKWKEIEITAKLFIGGKLTDQGICTIPSIYPEKSEDFLIEYCDIDNRNVSDSVRVDIQIKAIKVQNK